MLLPVTRILGTSGTDLVPGWGPALVSATLTDNDGGEADELVMVFAADPPFPPAPAKGTPFFPSFGWSSGGVESMRDGGRFEVQNVSFGGDAESGYTMTVTCRSADFVDKMKEMDSEHYEDTTAGDIFQKIASAAGVSATVDPEIAAAKIPYRLRWGQSPAGFATDLAGDLGGTMKLTNGKLLVAKRNSGKTASGTTMPPIVILFTETIEIGDISIETRPEFKETGTSWFDTAEGVMKQVTGSSVGTGGRLTPVHPYSSEDEAKAGGAAQGGEQARSAVSGSVTIPGRPEAMAGAPVILIGFGPDLDGAKLVAPTITHERTFGEDGGYLMTVDLESMKAE